MKAMTDKQQAAQAGRDTEHLSFSADASNTVLAHLCGPLDENLRQMETIVGARIARRGNLFHVSGERRAAQRAVRALEVLLDRVKREGKALSVDDIQWHFVGNDDEYRAKNAVGTEAVASDIQLKTRRRDLQGRTPNQRAYLQAILTHDISFGIGPAGTGKTFLAVATAVDAFERGMVERIVLTRPAVEAGERLGFLPGDLAQKVDPYLRPLYDALFDLMGFDKAQRLMERQSIEVAPLAYMRGRTLNNAFVILDEAQNTTAEQMKMFLTRMGVGSKVVVTGDVTQIDLPDKVRSGLMDALHVLRDVEGIAQVRLTEKDVVRHRLVQQIVKAYEKAAEEKTPGSHNHKQTMEVD
uniref:PhoH family protein n=1 Tax=Gemmiger formicilis TaxID=745368 RepID=UPI003FF0F454